MIKRARVGLAGARLKGPRAASFTGKSVDEDIELGGTAPDSEESLLGGNRAEKHFVLVKIKDRCDDTA